MIKIGGVPEHFNLPILMAIEKGEFQRHGMDLQWTYYPGGTGAMTRALAYGELDMAILLTEGFISAAHSGLSARIVKVYIDSPLVWGIHSGAGSHTNSIYDATQKKYAISRFGSGSHLMAMIHAEQRGEQLQDKDFVVINSLEGAIESLTRNETQVFYWEKMMTKKHVDNGEVKQIGEFSAPWSSFLIVATEKALTEKKEEIHKVLELINIESTDFKNSIYAPIELQKRFDMSSYDIINWMGSTVWNTDFTIRKKGLENAIEALSRITHQPLQLDIKKLCDGSLEVK